jgi:hypothetical protein
MKLIRRSSFTLLEILISLALTSVVMGFAFTTIRRIVSWSLMSKPIKEEVLTRGAMEQQLLRLFSLVPFVDHKEPRFYTKLDARGQQTLRCTIDQGIDSDHDFSGIVQAELFVDDHHQLILEIHGKEQKTREDILMEDVEKIYFKFLYPSDNKICSALPEKESKSPPMVFTLFVEKMREELDQDVTECYTFYPSYHIPKRGIPMYHLYPDKEKQK